MMRPPSPALLALLALAPGCYTDLAASALSEVNPIDDTSTTGGDDSGSAGSGPISTVTSATTSSGGGSEAGTATDTATDTDGATSGDAPPVVPPAISKLSLTPDPIQFAGPIAVTITADADGVWMDAGGQAVELAEVEPGHFEGEILIFSGFDNGGHEAVFTPWRDVEGEQVEGAPRAVPYSVELPSPGSEALWDVDYASGSGQVAAMGVLYGGSVVELVTLLKNGVSGCYLRRRDEHGISGPDDLVVLFPDHCKGIDLVVGEDGIYVLIDGETNAGWMWWAGKMPYFGAPPKSIAYGSKDEVARALALSESGVLAICGSAPTPEPGDLADAMVRIVRPDYSVSTKTFDYVKDQKHVFDEQTDGCAFDPNDDNRLLLVGAVYGRHDTYDNVKRNRRFDVVYNLGTDHGDLRVANTSLGATQSVATDVVISEGHAFVVGYVCETDFCDQIEAQMWTLDGDGDLTSTRSLGLHSNKALGPSRIRVSPGGYLVVASGGPVGSETAFLVRAFDPFKADPLWSYQRQDAGLVHLAHALVIGPYGQVYAGGFGANGHPLFVIVFG